MAGGIGDDEFAFVGRKEAIGDINRDALFAFGLKPVEQQGEIDLAALGADLAAIGFKSGKLILEDQFGIPKQTANQGRFAIINAATRDEAQQAFSSWDFR